MKPFRTETDSMGKTQVPADALYGAQTARALENFPISSLRFPRGFIRALGLIKKHAARTNTALGLLPEKLSQAIQQAAQEASRVFTRRCVVGLQADLARCTSNLEQSLLLCTALAPVIGYDQAAGIARLGQESGRAVREVAREMSGLGKAELEALLDPAKLPEPELMGTRI